MSLAHGPRDIEPIVAAAEAFFAGRGMTPRPPPVPVWADAGRARARRRRSSRSTRASCCTTGRPAPRRSPAGRDTPARRRRPLRPRPRLHRRARRPRGDRDARRPDRAVVPRGPSTGAADDFALWAATARFLLRRERPRGLRSAARSPCGDSGDGGAARVAASPTSTSTRERRAHARSCAGVR